MSSAHQRDNTPKRYPALDEDYVPQDKFPISHFFSANAIRDVHETRFIVDAIAVARRLVFSPRSKNILVGALSIRAEPKDYAIVSAPLGGDIPPSPDEARDEIRRCIDLYERSNVMKVVIQRNMGKCWGYVLPDESDVINLGDQHLKKAALALKDKLDAMYHAYVYHLAVIAAHEMVHSIRYVFSTFCKPTPPGVRDHLHRGSAFYADGSVGSARPGAKAPEGIKRIGTTGESGWDWEAQFLGGASGYANCPAIPDQPEMISVVLLKTVIDEEICVRALPPDIIRRIVKGGTGWESLLPFELTGTRPFTSKSDSMHFRADSEEDDKGESAGPSESLDGDGVFWECRKDGYYWVH